MRYFLSAAVSFSSQRTGSSIVNTNIAQRETAAGRGRGLGGGGWGLLMLYIEI